MSNSRKPKCVVLSAPSGTGKSTLTKMLLEREPRRFGLSISYTTRALRGSEKDGIHYHFVNDSKFQEMILNRDFLEYAHVFKRNWYGTAKKTVDEILKSGRNVLFDIDIEGAASIKKVYNQECVTVFLHPPSFDELVRRLRERKTDTEDAIQERLKTAKLELKVAPTFDYQVTNLELERTYQEILGILKTENCV